MKNARFWFWYNESWVKLTLEPYKQIWFDEGGPNEEGYSYTHTTITHDGDGVGMEVNTRAKDCDGRLDAYANYFCPLDELQSRLMENHPDWPEIPPLPEWDRRGASQRDYSAEAAGY